MTIPRPVRVEFQGHGPWPLVGLFQQAPAGDLGCGFLLCHCFTCSKDYKILAWISRGLAMAGCPSLRFDFSGLGESGGDFRETTLTTDIEDLMAAAGWMKGQGIRLAAVVGHSLGGAAAILAATRLPDVSTVAVLGTSWRIGARVRQLLSLEDRRILAETGAAGVMVRGRRFPVTAGFLEDLERYSITETVASWDKGLLVMQGEEDNLVTMADAQLLFSNARNPKAFVCVPGAGHLFDEGRSQAEEMSRLITAWVRLVEGSK